jgi:predicted oxidoreductase
MLIQTKCAIKPGAYDCSKDHILASVDGSLKRLQTDHVDFLLLHRPDTLCEPEEVAEAFDTLQTQGKVLHFGVSNENPYQIQLLNKYLKEKICINQLQFGLGHTTMVDAGLNVNMNHDPATNRDGGVLDFCRLNDITIQPWSPFQYGFFEGAFIGNPKFQALNEKLEEIAARYGITPTGLAIAWILRHPACMQPIVGSVNPGRLQEICAAADVTITRQEWYDLYCSTGKKLP